MMARSRHGPMFPVDTAGVLRLLSRGGSPAPSSLLPVGPDVTEDERACP